MMTSSSAGLFDQRNATAKQLAVLGVALATLTLDGVDVQLLALVTPLILAEWQIDKAVFAPVLAAALIGMTVGTSVGGWMGDRWGRKPLLVGSTVLFGFATLAVSLASGPLTLTGLRFVSGLGFGAAFPSAFALGSEWLPGRLRGRAISVMAIGTPLGAFVAASSALALVSALSWRGCFIVCGIVTLMLGVVMLLWLPESPSYLMHKGKTAQADRELRRIAGVTAPARIIEWTVATPAARDASASIFAAGLRRLTFGSAFIFFLQSFLTYATQTWMTTVLTTSGLSLRDGITASLLWNVVVMLAVLSTGLMLAKFGSKRILLVCSVGGMIFYPTIGYILMSGQATHSSEAKGLLFLTLALSGATVGFMVSTIYAVVASSYPVGRRATGIGFTSMSGRLGGITAILTSGLVLQIGGSDLTWFFAALFIAMLASFGGAWIIDKHILRGSE